MAKGDLDSTSGQNGVKNWSIPSKLCAFTVLVLLCCVKIGRETRQTPIADVLIYDDSPNTSHNDSSLVRKSYNETVSSFPATTDVVDNSVSYPSGSLFDGILNNEQPEWVHSTVDKSIRKWGCNLTETPFVFVHIGKAGGGSVRTRFAAAALDYNRQSEWHKPQDDNHYYPVSEHHKAKFCNSVYWNYRIPNTTLWPDSFEGNAPCMATTPIGMALSCPQASLPKGRCMGCDDWEREDCHTVYTGHNNIGSELHWLPPKYLSKWWRSTPWGKQFQADWRILSVDSCCWCINEKRYKRPLKRGEYNKIYDQCSIPLANQWDRSFSTYWREAVGGNNTQDNTTTPLHIPVDYSPIYASMPVRRATVVREPWSWLVSKFFWQLRFLARVPGSKNRLECDDIEQAIRPLPDPGWAYQDAMHYLAYLCGDDCSLRLEQNQLTLEELKLQTEGNLRNSFAVVGLLN